MTTGLAVHPRPSIQPSSDTPEELYLELTNRCNLRCRTCPQYFGMPETTHDLSWERVLEITDQVQDLRRVVLHGIGEPLLHPELPRIIEHCKRRGAYVLFNSNGLLLRGTRAEAIARSGLDELRISIDGGTAETYRTIRGVEGFDRIFANLRAFEALKAGIGARAPRVSLWVTGMKANVGDLPRLVRLAAEHGIGEVYLQRLVFSGAGMATREQSVYRDAEAMAVMDEAVELGRTLGVTVRGSGELGTAGGMDGGAPLDPAAPWQGCRRPWRLMYVTANGNVLPCCVSPFTGVPYEGIVLGNVGQSSVANVWTGEGYTRWRAAMVSSEPPAACRGCGADWSL